MATPTWRVPFKGQLTAEAEAGLAAAGMTRAGGTGAGGIPEGGMPPSRDRRHYVRVSVPSADEAIGAVRQALEPHGAFTDFSAEEPRRMSPSARPRRPERLGSARPEAATCAASGA
jgi:hypothetical protein